MSHLILVLPDLLDAKNDDSIVGRLPESFVALSKTHRLHPHDGVLALSAVGLDPSRYELKPGPLMFAAMDIAPPPLSILFRLSVLSLNVALEIGPAPSATPEEARWLSEQISRLSSPKLTICLGTGLEHGAVWENGSLDVELHSPDRARGRPINDCLPEGDGDRMLRRLIDDSINLLGESEINRRRADEGLPPLNLLWPWGQGLRQDLPNLPIRHQKPITLHSDLDEVHGVANLARCRFIREASGFKSEWRTPTSPGVSIVVSELFTHARGAGRLELAEEIWQKISDRIVRPWTEAPRGDAIRRLEIVSPSTEGSGLISRWNSHELEGDRVPLHERALHDERLAIRHLWESLENSLSLP